MKKVVLYNPSITSLNMGDHIIVDSAKPFLEPAFRDAFVVEVSTHLPVSDLFANFLREADQKFVMGTNLLRGRMDRRFRQWDVNIFNAGRLGPATLMGVGWWQYGDTLDRYTGALYRRVLSRNGLHSVRDSFTRESLAQAGITNVVNTGCPTLWRLTPDHCHGIPEGRGDRVVTTVTDYHKDPEADLEMLKYLQGVYGSVSLWLQGLEDDRYAEVLRQSMPSIELIAPTLDKFDEALSVPGTDFVGTRLHAGIRALQKGRRSIIVSFDNRAQEMSRDFGLVICKRGDLSMMRSLVEGQFETKIVLPVGQIDEWLGANGLPGYRESINGSVS